MNRIRQHRLGSAIFPLGHHLPALYHLTTFHLWLCQQDLFDNRSFIWYKYKKYPQLQKLFKLTLYDKKKIKYYLWLYDIEPWCIWIIMQHLYFKNWSITLCSSIIPIFLNKFPIVLSSLCAFALTSFPRVKDFYCHFTRRRQSKLK